MRTAVVDFDMTTGITIGKETPSLSQFKDSRFAVADILNAKPTRLLNRIKKYKNVVVLTARSSGKGKMRKALQNYFKRNGLLIPEHKIIMTGDMETHLTTAERKVYFLSRLGQVDFYDDDSRNVEFASSLDNVKVFQV